jgi:hypothetical protein
MRVRDTVTSLLRRWYIMVFGVLLTAGMCWVVQGRVPVTYEAKGSQVLMPPAATVAGGNPYLYLGGLNQALDVLVKQVTAAEAVKPVLDDFPDTEYRVEVDRNSTGSILVISASGPTPNDTLGVLHAALEKIPVVLKDMQDELAITDALRITVRTVVVEGQTTRNDQAQIRLTMLAAGSGMVGTIFLTVVMDDFLNRRKKPRHTEDEKRAVPGDGGSETHDGDLSLRGAVAEAPGQQRARTGASSS